MSKYLNPKVDLTFKKVFGEHANLVKSLLNALLPLPDGMIIEKVEYLTAENVPENPAKKYSIVDVRCTDNKGRGFIVEMQNYWSKEFFSRTLFNAASMYSKQLAKSNPFEKLKEVYALALVNSEAFDYEGDDGYMQEFYIINKAHPTDIHRDISLIFVELQKYKPADKGSKAIKDLWLKFLTEIDENTVEVDKAMLDDPEISQALEIVERSAYSDGDIYAYEDYLLEVMTQHNSVESARSEGEEIGFVKGEKKGHAEGRAEGRAEGLVQGRTEQLVESIKKFIAKGFDFDEVVKILEIPTNQIPELRRLVFDS